MIIGGTDKIIHIALCLHVAAVETVAMATRNNDDGEDLMDIIDDHNQHQTMLSSVVVPSSQVALMSTIAGTVEVGQDIASIQRCSSCSSVWVNGEFGDGCAECGGYSMTRHCPLCMGQCGAMWTRSISMSQTFHKAHWNGECALSEEQKAALMLRLLVTPNPDDLTDAMEDLST